MTKPECGFVCRLGQFNCLHSDGHRLFCYHDRSGYKGLTLRKRHIGAHTVPHLEDSDLQANLEGETINHGFVVATHTLSRGDWQVFATGELEVIDGGLVRYSSKKKTKLMIEKKHKHSMPD
jgi:predicted glutamine amidotransferase